MRKKESKKKKSVDPTARRNQERKSTEKILHHQFHQHLATGLKKSSHEIISKIQYLRSL